jgi:hypothetical protein
MRSKNKDLPLRPVTKLLLILLYWFFFNLCFGFLLSNFFHNFFYSIDETTLDKSGKSSRKLNFKKIIKIFIEFFWKRLRNWFIRICQKFLLSGKALILSGVAIKIFFKKFKSLPNFKHNFQLVKNMLLVFWETFMICWSFSNEIFLLRNIRNWLDEWVDIVSLLMYESLFITEIIYVLWLIFIGIFGILSGFIFGVYKRRDEKYIFLLLFLLEILYNHQFDDISLKNVQDSCSESNTIDEFSKLSFKTLQKNDMSSSKIISKEMNQKPQIPFPILSDPFLSIDSDFIWENSKNYKFELFKFYQNVNKKVKY